MLDVITVISRHEPLAVNEISRHVELPVPIVAAVCNELRQRDVVDTRRPVRLTPSAREATAADTWLGSGKCPQCSGLGIDVPSELDGVASQLEALAERMPNARLELDQAHCTIDSKLRRAMLFGELGLLSKPTIFIGDDDLTSITISLVATHAGLPAPRVTVVDTDADLCEFIEAQADELGLSITVVRHDARQPLPPQLHEAFQVAFTDPPYTLAGAELFVSRAVSALEPRAGQHVLFAFGARRPSETVAVQSMLGDMGLAIRRLQPNFNEYLGAGVIGGTSHQYHLRTVDASTGGIVGDYEGPLYTADNRAETARRFRCVSCRTIQLVGPKQKYEKIADLKSAGCPECGGSTFRPMALRDRNTSNRKNP